VRRLAARAPAGLREDDVPERAHVRRALHLYVTDSFGGAVWRFALVGSPRHPAYGTGRPWAEHELLAPAPDDPLGFPLPGANGIGFDRPNHLYVANTAPRPSARRVVVPAGARPQGLLSRRSCEFAW